MSQQVSTSTSTSASTPVTTSAPVLSTQSRIVNGYNINGGTNGNTTISKVKKDQYIIIKERPAKILSVTQVNDGKFGKKKGIVIGWDIFTGKKLRQIYSLNPDGHEEKIPVPKVDQYEKTLLYVDDTHAYISGEGEKSERKIRVAEGIKEGMKKTLEESLIEIKALIIRNKGEEMIIGFKENR